jgi:antitoxin ParD1/3/4
MAQTKTQTLSLGEHWNNFIESTLSEGRYATASEMVRDGLRLLEERDANSKLQALRDALLEGDNRGFKNGNTKLSFQNITPWNKKFLQFNPNHRHCMALEKASLEGCFK